MKTLLRALTLIVALASIAPAQNLRTLTRATSSTGVNDSALVLVSDSANRTRAASTRELFRRPSGSTTNPAYAFRAATNTGLYLNGSNLDVVRSGCGALTVGAAAITINSGQSCANDYQILAGPQNSVTIPAYSFAAQSTLGISRTNNNELGFIVNGGTAGRVQSQGFLGLTGSAGSPSFTFINDQNTGLYNPGSSDTLAIATNGAGSLKVTGGATATLVGGAGNMTIQAGTGNLRTLSLAGTNAAGNANTQFQVSGFMAKISDGSGGTVPGLGFIGDTTMGIGRQFTDTLSVITGGVSRFRLSGASGSQTLSGGAGNMTIRAGTGNSRTMTLQATNGSGVAQNNVVLNADGSTTMNAITVSSCTGCGGASFPLEATSSGTASLPAYTWDGDENLGLYRRGADTLALAIAGVDTALFMTYNDVSNVGVGGISFRTKASRHYHFYHGSTQSVSIVDQGLRAPDGNGSSPSIAGRNDANTGIFFFGNDTLGLVGGGGGNTQAMKLTTISGDVQLWGSASGGIGLSLNAGTGTDRVIRFRTVTSGGALTDAFEMNNTAQLGHIQNCSATAPQFSKRTDTNTGICFGGDTAYVTTGGSFRLKVANNAATAAGDVALCITTADVVTKGATCGSSTMLIKDQITLLNPDASTHAVMQMKPVRYTYKPGFYNERSEFGLLAEDMAAIDQRLAFYAERDDAAIGLKAGDPYNVNHNAALALLISTVQQQQKTIEQLQQRVTALEAKVKQ